MAGHLNGSGLPNGSGEHEKIASLDDARRRAAARAKDEKRKKRKERDRRRGGQTAGMSASDWVIGAVFVAMALGMIWHWLSPLVGATGAAR
ncbi:MAG: hypothetical protein AB7L90_06755 [Hyphomicrobiaceae bacterium]